jgi:hypothetical protein
MAMRFEGRIEVSMTKDEFNAGITPQRRSILEDVLLQKQLDGLQMLFTDKEVFRITLSQLD